MVKRNACENDDNTEGRNLEYLIKEFEKRKISEAVNQALAKQLFKPVKICLV